MPFMLLDHTWFLRQTLCCSFLLICVFFIFFAICIHIIYLSFPTYNISTRCKVIRIVRCVELFVDIREDVRVLSDWVSDMERSLASLHIFKSWSTDKLRQKLVQHQVKCCAV